MSDNLLMTPASMQGIAKHLQDRLLKEFATDWGRVFLEPHTRNRYCEMYHAYVNLPDRLLDEVDLQRLSAIAAYYCSHEDSLTFNDVKWRMGADDGGGAFILDHKVGRFGIWVYSIRENIL